MPTLIIQLPGLPPVEHIVREDAITLGRMKGNSIALNETSVSLSHAKITRMGNDFFLKDLNSTNGTMLNGQSVTEARLRDGDQLKFGEVIAYFRLEPLAAPAATPASATTAADPVPAPKPLAQSVPAPLTAPVTASPATTAIRSAALPRPPGRKSSWPLLIAGGIAGLMVVGFLAWKFLLPPSATADASAVTVVAPKTPPAKIAVAPDPASSPAHASNAPTLPLDPNLENLLAALKSPDGAGRRQAASAIYNLGSAAQAALPFLPAALADADPDVRMWVALALVHNNVFEKATIPILVQTLHHENPTLRQVACLSLAMIPYTEVEKEPVIAALTQTATKDPSPDVANDALTALKIIAPDLVVGK